MNTYYGSHRMVAALDAVEKERLRQEELRMAGKFSWTCAAIHIGDAEKLAVLAEEFGEASKEVVEQITLDSKTWPNEELEMVTAHKARVRRRLKGLLRTELIQVAAVCVAWCEALDAEEEMSR